MLIQATLYLVRRQIELRPVLGVVRAEDAGPLVAGIAREVHAVEATGQLVVLLVAGHRNVRLRAAQAGKTGCG